MKIDSHSRWAILFITTCSVIGICLTCSFSYSIIDLIFINWKSIDSPPEQAVEILSAYPDSLYVGTISGYIYCFEIEDDRSASHIYGNWQRVKSIPSLPLSAVEPFEPRLVNSYPRNTIDQIEFTWKPEFIYDVRYAITSEGNIYRWFSGPNWEYFDNVVCLGLFFGLLLGVLLLPLTLKLRAKMRLNNRSVFKNTFAGNFGPGDENTSV